jgi:hypothetical protein
MLLLVVARADAGVACAPSGWSGYGYRYWHPRGAFYYERYEGDIFWRAFDGYSEDRGAIRFDLTGLPDTTVLAARLSYYQALGGAEQSSLHWCRSRFESLSSEQLFFALGEAPILSLGSYGSGWVGRSLGPDGVAVINMTRTQGWVQFGVVSYSTTYAYARGYQTTDRPYLTVWYGDCPDVALANPRVVSDPLTVGELETLAVSCVNRGQAVALDVEVSVYRQGIALDTVVVSFVQPGETADVLVEFTPSTSGLATYRFQVSHDTLDPFSEDEVLDRQFQTYPSALAESPSAAILSRVELSPNPTRGRVNITCRELGRWRLMDVAGRVVAEGRGPGGDIDLSRQRPGVYCLETVTESGACRTKLVRAE